MNSSEGIRGFVTFLILLGILTTAVVGFNYVSPSSVSNVSEADEANVAPLNLSVSEVTESSAVVEWATVDPASPELRYSKMLNADCLNDASNRDSADCVYLELESNVTSHRATINSLESGTTYFFRIEAEDKMYPVDKNHSFQTQEVVPEPNQQSQPKQEGTFQQQQPKTEEETDYDGFGDVNTGTPNREVLGINDNNSDSQGINSTEPVDPLSDIDKMIKEEFQEALTYNDLNYDFNDDGEVTMIDYPLFIDFVMNYEE